MTAHPSEPLDITAQFDNGSWTGTLYPGAGELVGAMRMRGVARPFVTSVAAQRCHERDGLLRALRRIRRFVTSNHLRLFITTTFAHAPTVENAIGDMERFVRRCRYRHDAFPFVWTLERGEQRGRLHGHLLAPVGLTATFEECWPHGGVHARVVGESLQEMRNQAEYLAKSFEDPVLPDQCYRVAKGFQPEAIRIEAASAEALLAEAEVRMGLDAATHSTSAVALQAQWDR